MIDEKKTKARLRKARKTLREFRKSMTEPPKDKMVREPEKQKQIWELLTTREEDIHSGEI